MGVLASGSILVTMGCGVSQELPDWSAAIVGDVRSGYESVMQIIGQTFRKLSHILNQDKNEV